MDVNDSPLIMEETCYAINEFQYLNENGETVTVDLMGQICRLCAKWKDNLIHLFSEPAIERSLVEMINLHLPLEVKVCDALPLHVCDSCIKKIEVCHELIQTSLESQAQLLELFPPMMEVKPPETLVNDKLDFCLKSTDSALPSDDINQSDIVMDQCEPSTSCDEINLSCYGISTNLDLETSQLHVPVLPEASDQADDVQESDIVENVQTGSKPAAVHKCWPCDTYFDDDNSLISHHVTFHSDTVFFCWECSMAICDKVEYEAHVSLHNAIRANNVISTEGLDVVDRDEKSQGNRSGTEETQLQYETVPFLLNLNGNSEVSAKSFGTLCSDIFEEKGIDIEPGCDAGVFFCENDTVQNEDEETGQLVEENQTGYKVRKHVLKENTILVTKILKVEFPLKCLQSQASHTKELNQETDLHTAETKLPSSAREKRKEKFNCQFCDKSFTRTQNLADHENGHTQESIYTCNVCEKPYHTKNSLRNHLYTHNEEMKPFGCEYEGCSKRFARKSVFVCHLRSHTTDNHFFCDICNIPFKQKNGLLLHNVAQHSDTTFACTVCTNTYKTRYLLTDHMRSHSSTKLYKCDECGMEFHQANRRNLHMAVHATVRNHKCHLCAAAFKRRSHLVAHIKRHNRTHAYSCVACGLPFDSLSEVAAHRKTHTQDELNRTRRRGPSRPVPGGSFKCPVCDKVLLTKVTLQNHLTLHTDVKPYQCDLCDQSFTTESNMTNHRVIHSGMKPFPCQYCPEGFMNKEEREIHERTHTLASPFVCELCNKEFTSRMNLNQHLAVHSDVRRHACGVCDQRFRRRDTLHAHLRTHTGERPFRCSFCPQSFKQKGGCTMHERRVHKDQVTDSNAAASISDAAVSIYCGLCEHICRSNEELLFHFESSHTDPESV